MLDELRTLLAFVGNPGACRADYEKAIKEANCLGKPSAKARALTARHLTDLYGLDPSITLFRTLQFFWQRDPAGQPLLAMICAYARDPILRLSFPLIQRTPHGTLLTRQDMEEWIDKAFPGRFSAAMLKSAAQNLNGTWTYSGHLTGKHEKHRSVARATSGSAAYALLLSYLNGAGGLGLFDTEYAALLDCSRAKGIDLAEDAARQGWIDFKRVGDISEIGFPKLLTADEKEKISELR